MKDYLMNGPATDIADAKIYDSLGSDKVRFILRQHQWGSNNRLLLFCNYSNDGLAHTTYIHFPSHTIGTVNQITDSVTMPYALIDGNHTLYFDASNIPVASDRDVYGAAFFLTLTPVQ